MAQKQNIMPKENVIIPLDGIKEHVKIILKNIIYKGHEVSCFGYSKLIDICFEFCQKHTICNVRAYNVLFSCRWYPADDMFRVGMIPDGTDDLIEVTVDKNGLIYYDFC